MTKIEYKRRLTRPDSKNKAFIAVDYGGKNHSILGNPAGRVTKGSVLPNCTGYVHGRAIEVIGDDSMLCRGNAENYWSYKDGFQRGQYPQVGAIACWSKGEAGKSSDGAGHVAWVEDFNSKGDIFTSDSGWTGTIQNERYFRTRWIKRINGTYALGKGYTFQGFIYIYSPSRIHSVANAVYRLYNPQYGTHMFTFNNGEANSLLRAGWTYEGVAWKAPKTSTEKVYRLYNPNTGDHLFTANAKEAEAVAKMGWSKEGTGFYSSTSKYAAVYRLYNQKKDTHHYTANWDEKQALIATGWIDEGIAFYGMRP